MDQLCKTYTELTPETWFALVAFFAGAAGRLAKNWAPKWLVPLVAMWTALLLSSGAAMGCGAELAALVPAVMMGMAAGGTAVGGHELLKKLAGRYLGNRGAALVVSLLGEAMVDAHFVLVIPKRDTKKDAKDS